MPNCLIIPPYKGLGPPTTPVSITRVTRPTLINFIVVGLASDLLQNAQNIMDVKQLSLKISDPGSFGSQQKPVISPSPSLRSRPQSFAQKLRSTGKSVKGMSIGLIHI